MWEDVWEGLFLQDGSLMRPFEGRANATQLSAQTGQSRGKKQTTTNMLMETSHPLIQRQMTLWSLREQKCIFLQLMRPIYINRETALKKNDTILSPLRVNVRAYLRLSSKKAAL